MGRLQINGWLSHPDIPPAIAQQIAEHAAELHDTCDVKFKDMELNRRVILDKAQVILTLRSKGHEDYCWMHALYWNT